MLMEDILLIQESKQGFLCNSVKCVILAGAMWGGGPSSTVFLLNLQCLICAKSGELFVELSVFLQCFFT